MGWGRRSAGARPAATFATTGDVAPRVAGQRLGDVIPRAGELIATDLAGFDLAGVAGEQ